MSHEQEMTREEKLKSLAKWRWELELLTSDIRRMDNHIHDRVHRIAVERHADIVGALVSSAERELLE